jgi:cell division protein FtsB
MLATVSRRQTTLDTRRPPRGRRTMVVVLGFVGCVILTDALVGEKGLLALARTRQEHQTLADDVARATAANARTREDIRRLTDDPAAIEELARRELGLIKPGEKLFIIRDVPPAGAVK